MEAFYLEIRHVHIASVLTSGALLLLRGLAFNLFGARWVLAAPLRYLSWTVDTVLLTAALMLTTIIRQYPFADGWLTVKVVLLVPYILLGYFALRAQRRKTRLLSLAGAALVFGYIYTVARAHHPLGFLA
ncbi:MAG: hypothetical protein B7Y88_13175 [Sphingomonadales bacterium 32-64-17]|nr:MAG: hypothetical protein B7Y88_13175 [Sphingomonadales bacterium 32-64-17]